jgi:hypothetical protein
MWGLLLLCCLAPALVVGQYSWEQYSSSGLTVRQWHSSVCRAGSSIITYGGYNNLEDEALNDLLAYDPVGRQWSPVSSMGGPAGGRYGHTASLFYDKMLLIGGQNITSYLSEVWELDLGTYACH